jgi:hypothetical protein
VVLLGAFTAKDLFAMQPGLQVWLFEEVQGLSVAHIML